MTWDVRASDLWVREIDAGGNILRSWNILIGQTPSMAASPGYDNIRIDARLKNFGVETVTVRLVGQTLGRVTGNLGLVIYTPPGDLAPNAESVHLLYMPMWTENVYERLWVDNFNLPVGNCPAGQPPPWGTCRQGELYDYNKSSRHLTPVYLPIQPPPETEHTSPAVKVATLTESEHTSPPVKLSGPAAPVEHTSANVKLTTPPPLPLTEHTSPAVKTTYAAPPPLTEHTSPAVQATRAEAPPPPPTGTCEERFPGHTIPLSRDAFGYAFCIVAEGILPLFREILLITFSPLIAAIEALREIKIELPDWLTPFKEWLVDFPALVTSWLEWFTNPVGKAAEVSAEITAEAFTIIADNVFRVTAPFAELFNPKHFQTEQIKDIVEPIYETLLKEEIKVAELYSAIVFAPWIYLFNALEELIVGTEPATYEAARARSRLMIMLSVEINAILTILRTIGKFAPIIVSSIEGLAEGLTQLVAAVLAIKSASEIYGPGWRASTLTPLERHWKAIALSERPSPAEYMSMRAEDTITKADYTEHMKDAGFSEEWSEKLYDEYLREPSFREFATLYRRQKISQTAFANLYETARLDRKFEHLDAESGSTEGGSVDAWLEQIYQDPTWRQLNLMATSGKLTDEQIDDLLKAAGTRPEYLSTLKEILKELPGATQRRQVLTLEARLVALDRLDEATYNADAVELKVASQVADMILRVERTRLKTGAEAPIRQESIGNLNTWYLNDIIDADTYRQNAQALAYDAAFIDKQLAYLDKKKALVEPPVTEREASRALWDTWYLNDVVTAEPWRAGYVALGYAEPTLTNQLAYLDKKKTPPIEPPPVDLETERDLMQSEALTAFKAHVIDEPTLRDRLDKLGRSDDAINVLVALAKMEMATEQRDATLAVYAKAYRQGAILRSDYLAKLIDNQYMPDAAELIVQTEELSWGTGIEALTAEQILNAWEQGFQTIEQTTDRLRKAGWTETDMKIRLSFSVIDMLKAKHLTPAEADVLWTDFGHGPEERARLAAWYGGTPA